MLQKRIIPCLLLKDGLLVKTRQFNETRYISEPIYAIKIFNDYEVDELAIMDIMASRQISSHSLQSIPFDLISKISDESCMPITYGGGIHSLQDIQRLFRAGVEKVCIDTAAVENPNFIHEASQEFGNQSIMVAIDFKKTSAERYEVFIKDGTSPTSLDPIQHAVNMQQLGAGEILLNSIDRDGMMEGYDISLIKQVTSSVNIPVIALGGAGTSGDFVRVLNEGGASAAAAGSMFVYFGKKKAVLINYPSRDEIDTLIT